MRHMVEQPLLLARADDLGLLGQQRFISLFG
jgi:hypothetical protein